MAWIVFYSILLVVYCASLVYSTFHQSGIPEWVARISALAAILTGFGNALQKSSLTVYFWFQKMAIRMSSDTTSRWWFSARYDGEFEHLVIKSLTERFQSQKFRFPSKVEHEDAISSQIEIDQTLSLNIQFESREQSEDDLDHVTVISKVMEVSYGHAKKKIGQQILPVLQAINDVIKPTNCSFELDVQFLRKNPFFAIYIAHLRPEQVQDYRVILHVDGSHFTGKPEKVEITKQTIHVTAKTTDGFRSMAEQFVLLSPDLNLLKASQ